MLSYLCERLCRVLVHFVTHSVHFVTEPVVHFVTQLVHFVTQSEVHFVMEK